MNIITVTLTEDAQREALLAGEPARAQQAYEVPHPALATLLQLPWTKVCRDGEVTCNVPASLNISREMLEAPQGAPIRLETFSTYSSYDIRANKRPENAAAAIEYARSALEGYRAHVKARRAKYADEQARYEAEAEAAATAWAALPVAERVKARRAEYMEKRRPEAFAEMRAYEAAQLAAREAAMKAEAAEHRALLRAKIEGVASEEQLERYAAGVLPSAELVALVKSVLFAGMQTLARYKPMTAADLEHEADCDATDAAFRSDAYTGSLTASEFAAVKAVKALAPAGATTEVRMHEGWCNDCSAPRMRKLGVRVTVEFAGEDYTQEFAT